MLVTNCYFCGSEHRSPYAEENGFHLVKCDECGLLYVADRPDDREIAEAHQQGIHRGVDTLTVTGAYRPRKVLRYLEALDDLFHGDLAGKRTWLDVGCGHGEFLVAIQKYTNGRIHPVGSEPNVHKQISARARGLDVRYIDLKSHERQYDVISMLNVYSHLPDPIAFIQSLKRLLMPHGELVLQTGNAADLSAEDQCRPFYLPDHLSIASERIVVGILERLGFEIVSIAEYPLIRSIAREVAKALLPNRQSRLKYCSKRGIYSKIDMFIRARSAT